MKGIAMENRSTINTSSDANFQALVIDDESLVREFISSVLREESWNIIGRSHAFIEVMKQVSRAADTNSPVLLTGESGTGKELVAATIHNLSSRRDQPFVTVNCASIPAELIESELFGAERPGLFEDADGGTIFLTEITETTPSIQEKLLHFLQTGAILRAESNEVQKVDVRLIAASNHNVEQEVAAGTFSNELFDRLSEVSIVLPPLRERREDIPALAQSFADRVYSLSPSVKFANEALALLEKYNWPGNIRELENAVVHAAAMCDGTIRAKDLPEFVRNEAVITQSANDDWVTLSVIEGRYVAQVLEHTRGNKQAAARVLAVDRKTLDRMIKRHHIDSHHLKTLRAKTVSHS
jgi:two-component system, NtrC family, response regulator AtoC